MRTIAQQVHTARMMFALGVLLGFAAGVCATAILTLRALIAPRRAHGPLAVIPNWWNTQVHKAANQTNPDQPNLLGEDPQPLTFKP